jgi:hypothetical protein
VARYPDWFEGLVGIENKPDLETPGALATQLRTDVSLGLLDRVVLATESHVTGAHLHRIPAPVGVWRVHRDAGGAAGEVDVEVIREAAPLDGGGGVELLAEHPGRTDVAVVDAPAVDRARRRVAERAYGKGWRPTDLPGCASMAPDGEGLPYCEHFERVVDPADCGPSCPGFEAADPPAVDAASLRAEGSAWDPDPDGAARRQAGLDSFE